MTSDKYPETITPIRERLEQDRRKNLVSLSSQIIKSPKPPQHRNSKPPTFPHQQHPQPVRKSGPAIEGLSKRQKSYAQISTHRIQTTSIELPDIKRNNSLAANNSKGMQRRSSKTNTTGFSRELFGREPTTLSAKPPVVKGRGTIKET